MLFWKGYAKCSKIQRLKKLKEFLILLTEWLFVFELKKPFKIYWTSAQSLKLNTVCDLGHKESPGFKIMLSNKNPIHKSQPSTQFKLKFKKC